MSKLEARLVGVAIHVLNRLLDGSVDCLLLRRGVAVPPRSLVLIVDAADVARDDGAGMVV